MEIPCVHCGKLLQRSRKITKPQCEACAQERHSKAQVQSRRKRLAGEKRDSIIDIEKKSRKKFLENGDFSLRKKTPWTTEEESLAMEWIGTQTELAQALCRSVLAVQLKIAKLRKARGIAVRPAARMGRPMEGDTKLTVVPISMSEDDRAIASRLGNGIVAKGVRMALRMADAEHAKKMPRSR